MINADFHIHSRYSNDGEFGVSEIVNKCVEREIEFFSLTDHNSVKGTKEAIVSARQLGIHFMPGIEIDCNYKGTDLHVLGYHINWSSRDFIQLEEDVYVKVMESFSEMIVNLNKLGFVIDEEAVLTKANATLPSAELIAEVMLSDDKYYSDQLIPYMKGGKRSDMPYINFYLDYFAQNKPAFVRVEYMSYQEAIQLIKDNGGIPVIAHPGLNFKGKEHIAEELLENGAEGLEVFNNYHNLEQINYFAPLVQQRKAIMTCGSDFHGKTKPLISIGQFKFEEQYNDYLSSSIQRLKR